MTVHPPGKPGNLGDDRERRPRCLAGVLGQEYCVRTGRSVVKNQRGYPSPVAGWLVHRLTRLSQSKKQSNIATLASIALQETSSR